MKGNYITQKYVKYKEDKLAFIINKKIIKTKKKHNENTSLLCFFKTKNTQ